MRIFGRTQLTSSDIREYKVDEEAPELGVCLFTVSNTGDEEIIEFSEECAI